MSETSDMTNDATNDATNDTMNDETGAAVNAVIARSIAMHRTLFADACDRVAQIHWQFVMHTHDRSARRIAAGMAAKLMHFATTLRDGDTALPATFGLQIMAYDIACRLQGLNPRDHVA
jgi:hypothetical protein